MVWVPMLRFLFSVELILLSGSVLLLYGMALVFYPAEGAPWSSIFNDRWMIDFYCCDFRLEMAWASTVGGIAAC